MILVGYLPGRMVSDSKNIIHKVGFCWPLWIPPQIQSFCPKTPCDGKISALILTLNHQKYILSFQKITQNIYLSFLYKFILVSKPSKNVRGLVTTFWGVWSPKNWISAILNKIHPKGSQNIFYMLFRLDLVILTYWFDIIQDICENKVRFLTKNFKNYPKPSKIPIPTKPHFLGLKWTNNAILVSQMMKCSSILFYMA